MKKKSSRFSSSIILFMVTILLISFSIPAWLTHKQNDEVITSSIVTPHEGYLDAQSQMEEEFKQELLKVDASQPNWQQELDLEITKKKLSEFPELEPINTVEATVNEKDPISLIKSKTKEKRNRRIFKEDQFNYHQDDVEELMLKGVTLEDIYMSDQIGNDWMVDPRQLLERKEKGKPSWEEMEKEIEGKVDRELSDITQKLNKSENQISKKVPNKAERLEILKQLDQNDRLSLDQAINSYKANKQEELNRSNKSVERGHLHE